MKEQGMGFDDMILQLRSIKPILDEGLFSLGNMTKSHMSMTIKQNKKRPGSNNVLEGSIKVYRDQVTDTRTDVGVGKTDELDQVAPYWYFINYGVGKGGMTIPAQGGKVPGYFGDHNPPEAGYAGLGAMIGGSVGEQFHYVKGGSWEGRYIMIPKMPIAPMNYIEKTVAWANSIVKIQFDKMNSIIKMTKGIKVNLQM